MQILVIVVAVVATIYTAGAAAPLVGAATGGAATTFGAGLAVLGGSGGLAGVAAAAIGGAVGSIASQGVAIGLGVQSGFSWSQVGLSAIGAGVTAGLGSSGLDKFLGANLNGFGAAVAQGAIRSTITQGISVATGLQDKFSWRGVAASAVSAGVAYGVNQAIGDAQSAAAAASGATTETFGDRLIRSIGSGLAAGVASAAVRGGSVRNQLGAIATDVIASAVANSWVESKVAESQYEADLPFRQHEAFSNAGPGFATDSQGNVTDYYPEQFGPDNIGQGVEVPEPERTSPNPSPSAVANGTNGTTEAASPQSILFASPRNKIQALLDSVGFGPGPIVPPALRPSTYIDSPVPTVPVPGETSAQSASPSGPGFFSGFINAVEENNYFGYISPGSTDNYILDGLQSANAFVHNRLADLGNAGLAIINAPSILYAATTGRTLAQAEGDLFAGSLAAGPIGPELALVLSARRSVGEIGKLLDAAGDAAGGATLTIKQPKILSDLSLTPEESAFLQKQFLIKQRAIERAADRGELVFSPSTDDIRISSLQAAYRDEVASRFSRRYGVGLDMSRLNADHPVDLVIGGSPTQRLKLLDESINKSVGASLLQAARKANLSPGDRIDSVVFIKK